VARRLLAANCFIRLQSDYVLDGPRALRPIPPAACRSRSARTMPSPAWLPGSGSHRTADAVCTDYRRS